MKHLLLLLLFLPILGFAQDSLTPPHEEPFQMDEEQAPVLVTPEILPQFPGGEQAMYKYLIENVEYPTTAKENGIQGNVYIQFIIDTTGQVTNVVVLRGVSSSLDKEAIRVIKSMPKWKPGELNGNKVPTTFTIPVKFKLT